MQPSSSNPTKYPQSVYHSCTSKAPICLFHYRLLRISIAGQISCKLCYYLHILLSRYVLRHNMNCLAMQHMTSKQPDTDSNPSSYNINTLLMSLSSSIQLIETDIMPTCYSYPWINSWEVHSICKKNFVIDHLSNCIHVMIR